jgi:hypothetical protein
LVNAKFNVTPAGEKLALWEELSVNFNVAYGLLMLIQDRAAMLLGRINESRMPKPIGMTPLRSELQDSADIPKALLFDISAVLDELNVFDMADGGGPDLRQRLQSRFKDFGLCLTDGKGLDAVGRVFDDLRKAGGLQHLPEVFVGLLSRQVGIGISFLTTLRNLGNPELPRLISEGWMKYFFAEGGFATVDGITITAPGHDQLSGVLSDPIRIANIKGLKSLVSERSAEQYVRDLIRIMVEVAADLRYSRDSRNLRQRFDDMIQLIDKGSEAKARRWFRGAGSLSEALVTSAVEEATLGVSEFQTNAVLAAAAATFAGTLARKATQHVFLSEVGV